MRYPASEKLEIIRLVEQSHLPVRRTLEKLGIPRATFYRWYDLFQTGGAGSPGRQAPRPDRVWNRIPASMCVTRSSNWRWMSRSCRRGNWRRASPTRKSYFVSEASSIAC